MKKVLYLIFASLLVLGACGQDEGNSNKDDNKKSQTKSNKKSNDPKKNNASDNKEKTSKDKQQANLDDNSNSETRNNTESVSDNNGSEKQGSSKPHVAQQQKPTNNGRQQADSNQQQASQNQQNQGTPVNKDMPVAHDGGQNGYGYGDYLAAKEATERGKAQNGGKLEGVGGAWPVQDGQSFESWRQAQVDWQNMVDSTSQPAK
ncbi:ABC transporter B family protein [Staphylococcus haemolyticus]|uniref:hypothetical protein n=1 Tax=Staphylococcus haemolyticus TaxID=1283 RepID=UPI00069EE2EC|nr:hypothetical protein [Staphylococcus haemolyticus]MBE7332055.1 hypothetical protein [Staphylococcus haemolyticus]